MMDVIFFLCVKVHCNYKYVPLILILQVNILTVFGLNIELIINRRLIF